MAVPVLPKEMTRRYVEAFASGDVAAMDHIFSPRVEFMAPGISSSNLDEIKAWHRRLPNAFPDLDTSIARQITTPTTAVTELTFTGTHDQPLHTADGTIHATRRSVAVRAFLSVRVERDLVVSTHLLYDQLELLTQLGLVPAHFVAR